MTIGIKVLEFFIEIESRILLWLSVWDFPQSQSFENGLRPIVDIKG